MAPPWRRVGTRCDVETHWGSVTEDHCFLKGMLRRVPSIEISVPSHETTCVKRGRSPSSAYLVAVDPDGLDVGLPSAWSKDDCADQTRSRSEGSDDLAGERAFGGANVQSHAILYTSSGLLASSPQLFLPGTAKRGTRFAGIVEVDQNHVCNDRSVESPPCFREIGALSAAPQISLALLGHPRP
ncbi:hypothetical protein K439DRAFT_1657745 [Ramaria rubella]|nr:hypothetical protein K439DRAFT_1657745 [Ramaria rubella]